MPKKEEFKSFVESMTIQDVLDMLKNRIDISIIEKANKFSESVIRELEKRITKWKKAANVSENRYKKAMKRVAEVEEEIKLLQAEFFKLKKVVKKTAKIY